MKIVSTTICKNNESIVRDAIASVLEHVDVCLILDNGSTDKTVECALKAAGDKGHVVTFEWSNFGAARNFALEQADAVQADWALTIDSDERMDWRGDDLRSILKSRQDIKIWHCNHTTRTYAKTRVVRIPSQSRWEGKTHECIYHPNTELMPNAVFWELGKSQEQLAHKFDRDIVLLQQDIDENPTNGRWHFYLGQSMQDRGRWQEAIKSYSKAIEVSGWYEERGWSAFKAAECACHLENWKLAMGLCAIGLTHMPQAAELCWLAGFACYKAGLREQAFCWAKMALPLSYYSGEGRKLSRAGFRSITALYEGPWDILRFCAPSLQEQQEADRQYKLAIEARNAR
jgi:tetratricopeptide (TPR) repeat protein